MMTSVTVSQVNSYIKLLIDSNEALGDIYVSGELSNVKRHFSGHIYMTLKDEQSQLKAVMFKGDTFSLRFSPNDGMKVLVRGRISVYEANGQYQLYVKSIEPDGVGALYTAYNQLKDKLEKEGLFSESTKKSLPKYPNKVGIVTAKTGAAVRDILNILKRRCPLAEPLVFPAAVQGTLAAGEIAGAINYINKHSLADVIIVGRGGGSIEDLWAFNEEIVARAIFASKIPVISAVGHETDYTISDFVADMRAPTPSGAAELCVPDFSEISLRIKALNDALKQKLIYAVEKQKTRTSRLCAYFEENRFFEKINEQRMTIDEYVNDLKDAFFDILKEKNNELEKQIIKLNMQNPLAILSRGYSILKKDEKIIKSVKELGEDEKISITLADGEITAITKKREEQNENK